MTITTTATWLDDEPTVEWDDFEAASARTRALVRRLAADKPTLRALVYGVEHDPALLAMCEQHQLLDYLVVYDAPDRDFRIRLHFSTAYHLDRPHDHRFSFTSLILRGEYEHIWHEADPDVDPNELTVEDLRARFTTVEREGACYTLHHSLLHTTITTDDTVSLFLRGRAEKDRSIITDKDTGRVWWRYGAADEDPERRARVRMGLDRYRELRAKAERLGVI